eukprot:XP_014770549.1 PREDICTED: solute carrier family 22 member 5-like isoform X2 [Octopus bimaculoides]
MKSTQVDVDGILRSLGQTGFFHTSQCILICASLIVASTNSLFYIFYAITPEYRCKNLTEFQLNQYNISINEVSLKYDRCSIDIINRDEEITTGNQTLDCLNGYYYTTPVDKSIVSQWDLLCNSVGLAESTQMLYTFGQMLYFLSSLALVCELYPQEKRIMVSGIFMCTWGLFSSSLGLIAYLLKDYGWNTLFLFNTVISGYFLVDFFFLKESVRWLFANSKVKAAEKIIKQAAKQNKVDFDKVWSITSENTSQEVDGHMEETSLECRNGNSKVQQDVTTVAQHTQLQTEKESSLLVKLLAIFKSPYLRKVTIVVSIERAVNVSSWNSVFQMMEVFAGNIYLNSSVVALFEVFSNGIYSVLARR